MNTEKFIRNIFVPAFVLFAFCMFRADAISCFQCSSLNPGCTNLTVNDTTSPYYVQCSSNQTFCRKTVHTILDNDKYVRITRACAWEVFKERADNCYENDDDFKFERSCQCFTDGCNSASSSTISIFLVAIASIFALKLC